jgi:hypothetical protein
MPLSIWPEHQCIPVRVCLLCLIERTFANAKGQSLLNWFKRQRQEPSSEVREDGNKMSPSKRNCQTVPQYYSAPIMKVAFLWNLNKMWSVRLPDEDNLNNHLSDSSFTQNFQWLSWSHYRIPVSQRKEHIYKDQIFTEDLRVHEYLGNVPR